MANNLHILQCFPMQCPRSTRLNSNEIIRIIIVISTGPQNSINNSCRARWPKPIFPAVRGNCMGTGLWTKLNFSYLY